MGIRIRRRALIAGAAVTPVAGLLSEPAAAAPVPVPSGGVIAEVRGGTREKLDVYDTGAQRTLTVSTRGFADGWVFTPGDLVVVGPAGVAEPFIEVVRAGDRFEAWVPNLVQGPRLQLIRTHG
jgi:hypothetical protein